jgi:type I restriction enzyme R subunit
LDRAIRGIIGRDAHAVRERFEAFVNRHPLASHQIKFLDLLTGHIAKYGSIEVGELYESPFTLLHQDGPDGLFDEPLMDELLDIIGSFRPPAETADATTESEPTDTEEEQPQA